jgi:integrase
MALSVKKIERLKSPGRFADGHGLYLQVMSATNRSWLFRYVKAGRERWMGLGPLHTFDLAEARELARKARQQIREGTDPLELRKATKLAEKLKAAKAKTFQECADEYYATHENKWKNLKWRQQFKNTLRDYVLPKIGELSIADIDTGQVLRCVEPIWKTKTPTADRVRCRIQAVLDWATVRNYRVGENPARWDGHLEHILPRKGEFAKTDHHAALPYAEMPTFMAELRALEGIDARALELTILTALRTQESIGGTWDEIDLVNKVWTIPVTRMKASKKDHRIPLSDRAVTILQEMPRLNDFVFAGRSTNKPLSKSGMPRLLQRLGYGSDRATVHGFRATFRTWAAENTAYPNPIVEQALGHTVGSAVERAYQRSDLLEKRRRLMQGWASYCGSARRKEAIVTPLRVSV